ncbi:MAG: very short patch repair endonuclease [Sideroxyarcus sp.]
MTDTLSPTERSARMRLVKSKDTGPELVVRGLCRALGHTGYRLHRKEFPGKPDIAFMSRKLAIFVHGCFWHGHDCHGYVRQPKSKQDYWIPKINRNRERDAENLAALKALGWRVLVVWECETKNLRNVSSKLTKFLRY